MPGMMNPQVRPFLRYGMSGTDVVHDTTTPRIRYEKPGPDVCMALPGDVEHERHDAGELPVATEAASCPKCIVASMCRQCKATSMHPIGKGTLVCPRCEVTWLCPKG